VRDQSLPVVQSKRFQAVRGGVHQVRQWRHDDLLDILHPERGALTTQSRLGQEQASLSARA
jgi:hypothetical protein